MRSCLRECSKPTVRLVRFPVNKPAKLLKVDGDGCGDDRVLAARESSDRCIEAASLLIASLYSLSSGTEGIKLFLGGLYCLSRLRGGDGLDLLRFDGV